MIYLYLLFLCCFGAASAHEAPPAGDPPHFVIVIPSYNNARWAEKNLASVAAQTYTNWSMIYVDDCSQDATSAVVERFIAQRGLQGRCRVIRNGERRGALANIYNAVHECNPHHIVVLLDGDDRLANKKVLAKLAHIYTNPKVWMTYGNFKSDPAGWGSSCARIRKKVRKTNSFRQKPWVAVHLRTFYAKLFHLIKKEDLMLDGQFFPMTYDMAIMFPMLEMASRNHFVHVRKVLYIYNTANPIMDCRVNAQLQRTLDRYIRAMPPYQPLHSLF